MVLNPDKDFRAVCAALLQGDRTQGETPSPAWVESASTPAPSQALPSDLKRTDAHNLGQAAASSGLPAAPELRLTTTQLFVCRVDSFVLTLPFKSIAEILIPQVDQVKQAGNQRFLYWQERLIPIYRLFDLLDYAHSPEPTPTFKNQALLMLVFSQDSQILALELKIDQLLTEPELAIKPFEAAIAHPSYVYGSMILKEGRLVLVLDGAALLNLVLGHRNPAPIATTSNLSAVEPSATALLSQTAVSHQTVASPTILVVDDAKVVRQILDLTLRQAGYQVLQAQDGWQALEELRRNSIVRLVICDIEMPNMDGFEFLSHRRQDPRLAKIPVIMLTTCKSVQNRQLATRLGARGYFTKPYVEEELLAVLKMLLDTEQPGTVAAFPQSA